jgi:hypothetical protein
MALSSDTVERLMVALASRDAGVEAAQAIDQGSAQATQDPFCMAALITATNVSTTIDFGALKVGDKVVMIPTVAGNAAFFTVATAGTLPAAAVVGNLYLVLRAFVASAKRTEVF